MEITQFGHAHNLISIVHDPAHPIEPRIIDKTRWILLSPALLSPLQEQTAAGWRESKLSSSTWQAIQRPYLLEAHPITHHGRTTVYPFGHMASAVTVIHTGGEPLELMRVGTSNIILLDRESLLWLKMLVMRSPRNTHKAIPYLKSFGLRPSSKSLRYLLGPFTPKV